MAIRFHNEHIRFELRQKIRYKKWINKCIDSHQGLTGDISFIFTSNEQLRLMNRDYLNHDYFTDVITFDYTDGNIISGDIFISVEQVDKNAGTYQCDPEDELKRVMIHGVLHLLGFKDSSAAEKKKMREKENEALHLW